MGTGGCVLPGADGSSPRHSVDRGPSRRGHSSLEPLLMSSPALFSGQTLPHPGRRAGEARMRLPERACEVYMLSMKEPRKNTDSGSRRPMFVCLYSARL